jgi:hypothetical protein
MARASIKVVKSGFVEPAITVEDCVCAVAVAGGVANARQAKHLLDWIMREAARVQDLSFQLGVDGTRATDFAEGRRYVGHLMRKLLQPETLMQAQTEEKATGPVAPMSDAQAEALTRGNK